MPNGTPAKSNSKHVSAAEFFIGDSPNAAMQNKKYPSVLTPARRTTSRIGSLPIHKFQFHEEELQPLQSPAAVSVVSTTTPMKQRIKTQLDLELKRASSVVKSLKSTLKKIKKPPVIHYSTKPLTVPKEFQFSKPVKYEGIKKTAATAPKKAARKPTVTIPEPFEFHVSRKTIPKKEYIPLAEEIESVQLRNYEAPKAKFVPKLTTPKSPVLYTKSRGIILTYLQLKRSPWKARKESLRPNHLGLPLD